MKPIDSLAVFKQYARSNLVELDQCSLREGFDQMIQFFTNVKPVGCAASFGDALLFQWGIYNWDNKSDRFEINITRQFIEQDGIDDELEISQLELTLVFNRTRY